ncbi:hypothetical protein ITI46_27985 [Streptomyces oryzae]|uniref:Uncharacterized protein n=1 Tax=Streptomyces oryzae TaxID=1434886 RepID=A0ABS3XJI0_9ACTN|nr:hypothetical protein [Streptomyces oryzae]MBO8195459.1 hypothetical protein [Streptomyces oryzae]
MTAQQSEHRASADGHIATHGTPPMSELLASCAAAAAVSRPPREEPDGEQSDRD